MLTAFGVGKPAAGNPRRARASTCRGEAFGGAALKDDIWRQKQQPAAPRLLSAEIGGSGVARADGR